MKFSKAPHDSIEEKEIEEMSWFTRLFSRFRKSVTAKVGTAPNAVEAPKPPTIYKYHVDIKTGAGVIKMSVEAENQKQAEQDALVAYVKNVKVSATLYRK